MRIRQSTNQQQATIGDILCENVKFFYSLFLSHKSDVSLVPRHDGVHQVLLVAVILRSLVTEVGGGQARV